MYIYIYIFIYLTFLDYTSSIYIVRLKKKLTSHNLGSSMASVSARSRPVPLRLTSSPSSRRMMPSGYLTSDFPK